MNDFFLPKFKIIKANDVDELIVKGIKFIKKKGKLIKTRAGSCQQAYGVTYVLLNPRNRIHYLRAPKSITYLAKELLAYFEGSLDVNKGLGEASNFWRKVANEKGYIFSNYGYYVFHQRVNNYKSQYHWALDLLLNDINTRRALININQVFHKIKDSRDFPCTIGVNFFIIDNTLYCSVFSRSSDIFWGIPYDVGFFSFVHELIYAHLKQLDREKFKDLQLGPIFIKTLFTQIYDFTRENALNLIKKKNDVIKTDNMPEIIDAELVLDDIYNHTSKSETIKWIYKKVSN